MGSWSPTRSCGGHRVMESGVTEGATTVTAAGARRPGYFSRADRHHEHPTGHEDRPREIRPASCRDHTPPAIPS